MEALKTERFLGNINLARWTFEQIQNQKLQTLVYYDYLKGFVFKYQNNGGFIERKYIPANSLSQLLDRFIVFKHYGLTNHLISSKPLIVDNNLGELPDNIYSQREVLNSKLNKI